MAWVVGPMNTDQHSYRWVVLAMVFAAHFAAFGLLSLAVPALVPLIAADLGITAGRALLAFAAISFTLVFAQLPGGAIGDRFSLRWVVGGGILLSGIATALRWVVPTLPGLIGTSLLLGLGIALVNPNIIKTLTQWFAPDQLGLAQGINLAGFTVGAAIAGSLSAGALHTAVGSWERVFLVYGAFTMGIGLLWIGLVRSPRPAETPRVSVPEGRVKVITDTGESTTEVIRGVLSIRATYLASLVALFSLFVVNGGLGVLPSLADRVPYAVPEVFVGTPLYAATVGALGLPTLSDRLGRKPVLYGGLLGTIVGVLVVGAAPNLLSFVLGMVIAGVFGGGLFGMLYIIPGELPGVGPARAGTMAGVMLSFGQLGGTLGPIIGGAGLDAYGIHAAVLAIALPALLGLPALWAIGLEGDRSAHVESATEDFPPG